MDTPSRVHDCLAPLTICAADISNSATLAAIPVAATLDGSRLEHRGWKRAMDLLHSTEAEEVDRPVDSGERGLLALERDSAVSFESADALEGIPEDIRALEGADLNKAVARALSDEGYKKAREALLAKGPFRQDVSHATAFAGVYGPGRREVVVVLIPFPDKNKPVEKSGLVAFAMSEQKTATSYCILEKAEAPSEMGAIDLEIPNGERVRERLWLWEPSSEGTDIPLSDSNVRKYFKCVIRNAYVGCVLCVTRCLASILLFMECMKFCCAGAFGFAVISCAVELMLT